MIGVVLSTRLPKARYGFLRGAWHHIRRSGLAYALYLWVATTWTEALSRCAVRRLIRRHAIPNLATRNINDARGLTFAAVRPDVLVSAFFNQRIGEDLLRLPSIAAVNVRPSLLPDYKGVDPVFFARLHGAPRLGVTVHHLERDLGAGRVLVQQTLAVSAGESVFRTTARLLALGGCLLASRLALPLTRQSGAVQSGCGHYDSWPSAAEVARLRGRGIALVRACDLAWARRLGAGDGADAG